MTIVVMTLIMSDVVSSRGDIYHSGFLNNLLIFYGAAAPCGTGPPHYRCFTISCRLTDHIR